MTSSRRSTAADDSESDRWSRGLAAYASQFAIPESDVLEHMTGMLGERMAHEAIVAAGGAWVDDCLSPRDRSLIVIASLVTQGGVEARLRGHLRWALEHGATGEELEALMTLLAVYTGYPRASTAIELLRDELATREDLAG
jgi:4-carboxymuconolactone decarboxylase